MHLHTDQADRTCAASTCACTAGCNMLQLRTCCNSATIAVHATCRSTQTDMSHADAGCGAPGPAGMPVFMKLPARKSTYCQSMHHTMPARSPELDLPAPAGLPAAPLVQRLQLHGWASVLPATQQTKPAQRSARSSLAAAPAHQAFVTNLPPLSSHCATAIASDCYRCCSCKCSAARARPAACEQVISLLQSERF